MSESYSPRRRRHRLLAIVATCGAGAILWYWFIATGGTSPEDRPVADPPPPDPRRVFVTPYRNVRPEVGYVGDGACSGCHAEIAAKYRTHPMARSAEWVGSGAVAAAHATGSNNPTVAGIYQLRVDPSGDRVRHSQSLLQPPGGSNPAYSIFADLAIGSGRQGKSYLSIDRGSIWQSPLSRFHKGDRWDVSPGFELGAASRRAIAPGCLFCHTDPVTPVDGTINSYREPLFQYQAGIGCERCHGPGEIHIAERTAQAVRAGIDDSIVNPSRLTAELKADVCRQCHLQGETRQERRGRQVSEYRPGLPLDQFVSVFVPHPELADSQKSVGQFELMEQSGCYLGSAGRMSCTSCHDPHAAPSPPIAAYYRTKCQTCHADRGCSAPPGDRQRQADSCIACHMPARDSSNIIHAAVTDHRIPRRPGVDRAPRGRSLPAGQFPLVHYRTGPHAPPIEERERDGAIVFAREIARTSRAVSPELTRYTQEQLEAALARWPGDAECWTAAATFYESRSLHVRALAAARRAVALAPQSESAMIRLAECASVANDFALMADMGQRLIALNPSSADHRVTLATALVGLKQWKGAETETAAALAIHPLHPNARLLFAVCLDRMGDPRAGRNEMELGMRLTPTPAKRAAMSEWYFRQIRSSE